MASREASNATTFLYFGIVAVLGLSGATLGPSLPTLELQTGSTTEAISWLFMAKAGGIVLGSLFLGRLYERLPGHRLLSAALLCAVPALIAVPFVRDLPLMIAAMLIVGVCEGVLHVGTNTLLVRVHGARVAPYMNGLHFAFGVGATVAPAALGVSFDLGGGILCQFAGIALLMALQVPLLYRLPDPETHDISSRRPDMRRAQAFLPVLFLLMFLVYVGAESSVSGWIYSYAVKLNLADEAAAAWLTSLFWGGLTLGRLMGVQLSRRFAPRRILVTDLLGGLVAILWMGLLGDSFLSLAIGTALYGFMISSIFPTLMAFAGTRMTLTGGVTGLFFVGSAIGGMSVPWVVGQFFGSFGPSAMIVASVASLIAGGALLFTILGATRA